MGKFFSLFSSDLHMYLSSYRQDNPFSYLSVIHGVSLSPYSINNADSSKGLILIDQFILIV